MAYNIDYEKDIIYYRDIDIHHKILVPPISAKQYDENARYLVFSVWDDGEPYVIPEGTTVMFCTTKPDLHGIANPCEIIDGKVVYKITLQTTIVHGDFPAEFRFYRTSLGETKAYATPNFNIHIGKSALLDDTILSSDEVNVLTELIADATDAIAKMGAVVVAESNRVTAENTRVTAENTRQNYYNAYKVFETYSSTKAYIVGNKVTYLGSSFQNILAGTGKTPPTTPTNNANWICIAAKGDQGIQGTQGIQGVQGLKGDQGIQGTQGIQGLKGDKGDKGDQGIQGIQGIQGVKGTSYISKDNWSSGTLYVNDALTIDTVYINGSTYSCKLSHTSSTSNQPPNTTYWQQVAAKGQDGAGGDMFKYIYDKNNKAQDIFEYADTKASYYDKVTSQTGTFITCPVADNGLAHVKKIVGETVQKVTVEGKNKYPRFKSQVLNGITTTVSDDGTVTLNGTATIGTTSAIGDFKGLLPSGTYTLSANNAATNGNVQLKLATSAAGGIYNGVFIALNAVNKSSTFTIPEGTPTYIQIYVAQGTVLTNFVIKPQLEPGTTASLYEPHTPNSPSSEYPSPMEYAKEFDVMTGNKNLLPKFLTSTMSGITCTTSEDGTITLNGTNSSGGVVIFYLDVNLYFNGTHRFSFNNPVVNNEVNYRLIGGDGVSIFNQQLDQINRTSTFNFVNAIVKRIGVRVGINQTLNNFIIKPQLEYGASFTQYEQHKGDKKSISFPFMGLPNGVKNGKEYVNGVYSDALRVNEIRYDGSPDEGWTLQSINEYGIANFRIGLRHKLTGELLKSSTSDRFKIQETGIALTTTEGYHLGNGDTIYFRINKDTADTVEKFRNWLSTHITSVQYELTTPIITPTDEIYLETNKGTTHLFTNSYPQVSMVVDFKSELESMRIKHEDALENAVYMGDDIEVVDTIPRDSDLLGGQPKSYFEGLINTVDSKVNNTNSNLTAFKVMNFGRDVSIVGTQEINVGFKPRLIQFYATIPGVSGTMSIGSSDVTTNLCLNSRLDLGNGISDVAAVVIRLVINGSNISNASVISTTNTGFILNWTKVGLPTGNANVVVTAYK